MCINELKPGQSAIIDSITGDGKFVKRLLALGYIEGTKVTMKTSAPFGDPILLNLRGFDLALRKKDAGDIIIRGV